ncbi:hypothetical protein Hanom_Chr04g00339171 [Helianthus anomalus]
MLGDTCDVIKPLRALPTPCSLRTAEVNLYTNINQIWILYTFLIFQFVHLIKHGSCNFH